MTTRLAVCLLGVSVIVPAFVSEAIENIPSGYRARETYTRVSDDEVIERFEIAEPKRDFEVYSEARLLRVR